MSTKHKITPLGDKVLVKPVSEEGERKTKSGIIIPETVNKGKSKQGKVIAVGQGQMNKEGKLLPMKVKVGDIVLFSEYGPGEVKIVDEVKIDGEEYFILSEGNILAVIK